MGKCILLFAKSWQKYQNHLLHDHSQPLVLHTVRTNLFGNKHHQLIDAPVSSAISSRATRQRLSHSRDTQGGSLLDRPTIICIEFFIFFFVSDFPFLVAWRGGDLRSWSLIHLRFRLGPNPPGATYYSTQIQDWGSLRIVKHFCRANGPCTYRI